jgi:hypothetical protein
MRTNIHKIKFKFRYFHPKMKQFFNKISNFKFEHEHYDHINNLFNEIHDYYSYHKKQNIIYETADIKTTYSMLKCKKFNNEYTILYKPTKVIIFSDSNGYTYASIKSPSKADFKEILFRFLRVVHL